ncbi:hypothetical protein J6590_069274 [Homalodisca vitripennis]|nr:hypothetical protein J6590_069274 [Homalodisca vitripennis]
MPPRVPTRRPTLAALPVPEINVVCVTTLVSGSIPLPTVKLTRDLLHSEQCSIDKECAQYARRASVCV